MNDASETAIIIPYAMGETRLADTIRGINDTVDDEASLILVSDIPGHVKQKRFPIEPDAHLSTGGVGLSYARHIGLEKAAAMGAKYAVLLDSHMAFIPGSNWLSRLVHPVKDDRKTFACAASVRCRAENMDPVWHLVRGRYEMGSRLVDRQITQKRPELYGRKWRGNRDLSRGAEVPCPLGGAYSIDLSWYAEIGKPWEYHRAWGCSEQLVALATWAMGGRCWCEPIAIGHMYRDAAPYVTRVRQVIYNSILAAKLFRPADSYAEACDWMGENTEAEWVRKAIAQVDRHDLEPLRELYAPGLGRVAAQIEPAPEVDG